LLAVIEQVGWYVGVGGTGVEYTPTVTEQVLEPPGPFTVTVKVRVDVRLLKVRDPLIDTPPTSVREADVVFVLFHVIVLEPPY
jgi:hypothetical protein